MAIRTIFGLHRIFCFTTCLWLSVTARAMSADQVAERLFALEVKPLLAKKCFACHGNDADAMEGGLVLTSREAMLRGGETSQNVLVPSNSKASLIVQAVSGTNPDLVIHPRRTTVYRQIKSR